MRKKLIFSKGENQNNMIKINEFFNFESEKEEKGGKSPNKKRRETLELNPVQ